MRENAQTTHNPLNPKIMVNLDLLIKNDVDRSSCLKRLLLIIFVNCMAAREPVYSNFAKRDKISSAVHQNSVKVQWVNNKIGY